MYTEDVVVHSPRGGELRGIEAVATYLRQSHGDQAEASANQLVYFFRDGEPPHQTSGLRVAYSAARTPAGWRFRKAQITLAWAHKG